jgi:soluble lytic murein transglycosylase-like protein
MLLMLLRLVPLVCACALGAFAGEYAVLSTGYRMHIDRHEIDGSTARLYLSGGQVEMPAADITRFEDDGAEAAKSAGAARPAPPGLQQLIEDAAKRYGLPGRFLRSIAAAESGYRQDAVSKKGAVGVMQLMPETARLLNANPNDPGQNVDAGARYLLDLLVKYKDDPYQVRKAIAAYNAGPGAVDRYDGVPPYPETMRYVEKVIRQYTAAPKTGQPQQ